MGSESFSCHMWTKPIWRGVTNVTLIYLPAPTPSCKLWKSISLTHMQPLGNMSYRFIRCYLNVHTRLFPSIWTGLCGETQASLPPLLSHQPLCHAHSGNANERHCHGNVWRMALPRRFRAWPRPCHFLLPELLGPQSLTMISTICSSTGGQIAHRALQFPPLPLNATHSMEGESGREVERADMWDQSRKHYRKTLPLPYNGHVLTLTKGADLRFEFSTMHPSCLLFTHIYVTLVQKQSSQLMNINVSKEIWWEKIPVCTKWEAKHTDHNQPSHTTI